MKLPITVDHESQKDTATLNGTRLSWLPFVSYLFICLIDSGSRGTTNNAIPFLQKA